MKYLSLHKSKSDRAYKGGEILGIREATDEEVIEHHEKLEKENPEKAKNRKIVTFQIDRDWHALWPKEARKNPMLIRAPAISKKSHKLKIHRNKPVIRKSLHEYR